MTRRSLIADSLLAVLLAGITSSTLIAQTPPPPVPSGTTSDGVEFYSEDDAEALNRGALHEAFAAPVDNEPVVGLIVTKQPPEPIDEVPPELKPEGENIVWISGYFSFDEELDDFIWISGMWRDVPPGRTWVPGYWHEIEEGWQWVAGMWTDDSAEEITYLPEPPASQEYGPSSPSPGDSYFYIPGSWYYVNYSYQWRPGYWAPYQRDWIWCPSRYIFTPRGYVYVPGYWDYELRYRGVAYAPVHFHHYGPRRYRPVVLIDSWDHLILHLFVRPRCGYYAFGNYYADRYHNRYQPWYAHHRSRGGYDPLYAHFHARHGNEGYNRLVGWNTYFHNHSEYRPRSTYRAQQEFFNNNRENRVVAATTLASNLDRIQNSPKTAVAFRKVDVAERTAISKSIQDIRKASIQRTQFEGRVKGFGNAKIKTLEKQKIEIPKLVQQQKVPGISDQAATRRGFGNNSAKSGLKPRNVPQLPDLLGNRGQGNRTLPGKAANTLPAEKSETDPKSPTTRTPFGNRVREKTETDPTKPTRRIPFGNRTPGNTPTNPNLPKINPRTTPAPKTNTPSTPSLPGVKTPFTPRTPNIPKTKTPAPRTPTESKTPSLPKINIPKNTTPSKPPVRRTPTFKRPEQNSTSNSTSKFQNRPPPAKNSTKPTPPKIQTPTKKIPNFTPRRSTNSSSSAPPKRSSSGKIINRNNSSSSFSKRSVPVPRQTPQFKKPAPPKSSSSSSSKSSSFRDRFQQRKKND